MIPSRIHYWQIGPIWLFYILAALALAIFCVGVIIHVKIWARGTREGGFPFSLRGIFRLFMDGFLGRRIFKGQLQAGIMHTLISWGFLGLFLGTVIISIHYWIIHFLEGSIYLWFSAFLEILGLMMTIGLLWALFRRYLQRIKRLERRPEDLLQSMWLLIIVFSGFMVEGTRLASQQSGFASWSFVGFWISNLWADPEGAMPAYLVFWWSHAVLSLSFIAYIPFSKLFHILAAPTSLYLTKESPQLFSMEVDSEAGESLSFEEIIFLDACTRCGRCVEVCPSTGAGEDFTPRNFIMWTKENLRMKYHPLRDIRAIKKCLETGLNGVEFSMDKVWHCTTCAACLEVCPIYIAPPEAIQKTRAEIIEEGEDVPALLFQTLERLDKYDNPIENSRRNRWKWAQDIDVPDLTSSEEHLDLCYFVGCTTSLDNRAQEIARSFTRIMKHVGVSFGTLGAYEPCCGDIARRVGETGLFEEKMETCLNVFRDHHINKVITSSPHCFHTMRNEYSAHQKIVSPDEPLIYFRHYTEFLEELISSGSLRFETSFEAKVTYHDPCYLGRHNRIFNAPRRILKAIPGLELVEMPHCRENSLCCGGGGGRMWQDEFDGEIKMSEIRMREAADTGAGILVTACPLCLIMLDDGRKTANLEDSINVLDLNEVVATALDLVPK
jgi:Fe-S oxidoreductase/nitrate reductase gamma subunit